MIALIGSILIAYMATGVVFSAITYPAAFREFRREYPELFACAHPAAVLLCATLAFLLGAALWPWVAQDYRGRHGR